MRQAVCLIPESFKLVEAFAQKFQITEAELLEVVLHFYERFGDDSWLCRVDGVNSPEEVLPPVGVEAKIAFFRHHYSEDDVRGLVESVVGDRRTAIAGA